MLLEKRLVFSYPGYIETRKTQWVKKTPTVCSYRVSFYEVPCIIYFVATLASKSDLGLIFFYITGVIQGARVDPFVIIGAIQGVRVDPFVIIGDIQRARVDTFVIIGVIVQVARVEPFLL